MLINQCVYTRVAGTLKKQIVTFLRPVKSGLIFEHGIPSWWYEGPAPFGAQLTFPSTTTTYWAEALNHICACIDFSSTHTIVCLGRWDIVTTRLGEKRRKCKLSVRRNTHRSNLLHTIHTEGELSPTTTLHHQPAELNGDCIKYSYRRHKSAAERENRSVHLG